MSWDWHGVPHPDRGATEVSATGWASFSVVVPIYNEAEIVQDCLSRMVADFRTLEVPFEVLACENGSTDGTAELVDKFRLDHPEIRVEHLEVADYGLTLKHGMNAAKHEIVVIVNLDFWDLAFVRTAMGRLDAFDMVIGSKLMRGAHDRRPVVRRLITRSFNVFLRLGFGFRGTDTHGVKVYRREAFKDVIDRCVTDQWIFDTEFVLRAERAGRRILEVPVSVSEIRAPGYSSLLKRTPRTLRNLFTLRLSLWR
jgi:glycosyltransferase involved in cell wall biosynthesis